MTRRFIRHLGAVCLVTISLLSPARSSMFTAQQSAARPMPMNRAPTLILADRCASTVVVGQTCAITFTAADPDGNLSRVDLQWNDGTEGESKAVTGGSGTVTFSRSFTAAQGVNWTALAFDATGLVSPRLTGNLTVTAAPPPAQEPAKPASSASASPASEQDLAQLVVMIRGKLADKSVVGAGVILGIASDRLYVVTANHVVREKVLGGEEILAHDLQVQLHLLRGEWQTARLVEDSFDSTLDLAVLTVPGVSQLAVPKLPWASLVRPDTLTTGEQVAPIGYPGGTPWFMSRQPHVISSVGPQGIRTEGDFVPGYSGGALVTKDWGMVGIILNVGSLLNDVLRIDVAVQRFQDWGHRLDATFKERAPATGGGLDPAMILARDRQDAESLVSRWLAAALSRDIQTLVDLAEMPFYFDQEIVVRREDLRAKLEQMSARAADNTAAWKIQSIRATTVGELRAKGDEANRDRVLSSLSMTDADWQVVVLVSEPGRSSPEGTAFFVRKIGGTMKLVGLWD
jgi:S1-C subfamily serine protease